MLLSGTIPKEDLHKAHAMLVTFHNTAGALYTSDIYTAYMHLLLHTVPMVKVWGPLWCYSMFGFENINGYLGQMYHGTRHITEQMSFNIQLQQSLPYKLKELCKDESDSTCHYLESLVQDRCRGMQSIDVNCYSVGKVCSDQLTEKEKHALSSIGIALPQSIVRFNRVFLCGILYDTAIGTSRCNNICQYRSPIDGSIKYGVLTSFCKFSFSFINNLVPTAITPITKLRPPQSIHIRRLDSHLKLKSIISSVKSDGTLSAVPITNIMKKCIQINFTREYIIPVPNNYEVH